MTAGLFVFARVGLFAPSVGRAASRVLKLGVYIHFEPAGMIVAVYRLHSGEAQARIVALLAERCDTATRFNYKCVWGKAHHIFRIKKRYFCDREPMLQPLYVVF